MSKIAHIQPLFILSANAKKVGQDIIQFTRDDYNKELCSALIDAKNDDEAISAFLREYKDSKEHSDSMQRR